MGARRRPRRLCDRQATRGSRDGASGRRASPSKVPCTWTAAASTLRSADARTASPTRRRRRADESGVAAAAQRRGRITAPMPGKIVNVAVAAGDAVAAARAARRARSDEDGTPHRSLRGRCGQSDSRREGPDRHGGHAAGGAGVNGGVKKRTLVMVAGFNQPPSDCDNLFQGRDGIPGLEAYGFECITFDREVARVARTHRPLRRIPHHSAQRTPRRRAVRPGRLLAGRSGRSRLSATRIPSARTKSTAPR